MQLGISRVAVNRWVGRLARRGLAGLPDRAGRGRKPWLPQAAVQQVLEQAVTPPVIRERLSPGKLVLVASLLAYAAMALLSISRHWVPAAFAVVLFGAAWLAAGTTVGAVAQMTSPAWARARALGVCQVAFF